MADREGGRRGIDANNYEFDDERDEGRPHEMTADGRTPVERRRAEMGDGVGALFKWWAWLAGQYAVTFVVGTIMGLIMIILVPGFALNLLVPDVFTRGTVVGLSLVWIVFSLFAVLVWMKNRMASKGVNVRTSLF